MAFPLITCDAMIGSPHVLPPTNPASVEDLVWEMDRLGIAITLVRHRTCVENGPYVGNDVLASVVHGCEHLLPVPVLTPDGCAPEFSAAALVTQYVRQGYQAVWLAPRAHQYPLQPWCCGDLCTALQAHRLPVLLPYDQVALADIHAICTAFPALRVLLLGVPREGRHRVLYPLLRQHPELYLCFSPSFSVFHGLRDLCDTFGPTRWVFGAGYPEAEGGAAVTGLRYSGLTEVEMAAVASGNIHRLLAEVITDV